MIVKPNVRALFKGFLHSSAGGRGSQQSLIREGSVRGPTPYTFYSVFDRKCNSFVYLPLKNGTPYENTDEKGARGIKNNKNNRLIDKRVSRCSSVSKWKDLCFRQQRRLPEKNYQMIFATKFLSCFSRFALLILVKGKYVFHLPCFLFGNRYIKSLPCQ